MVIGYNVFHEISNVVDTDQSDLLDVELKKRPKAQANQWETNRAVVTRPIRNKAVPVKLRHYNSIIVGIYKVGWMVRGEGRGLDPLC